MDHAEVTKELVRLQRCPKCAAFIVDRETFLTCTECHWRLFNGIYDTATGAYFNADDPEDLS